MRINDYIGRVAIVELDTMATHEGMIEDAEGTHIKITNGSEVWVLPRHEIVKITPIQPMRFKSD